MSQRTDKSSLQHATNVQRQRIEIEDDFDVVQVRTSSLTGRGQPVDSARSPLKGSTAWGSGESWIPEDDLEFDLDPSSDMFDDELEFGLQRALPPEPRDDEGPASKKRRTQASARPNVYWKTRYRDVYLDELVRADGRGDFMGDPQCPDCLARGVPSPLPPQFRCRECFTPDLTCGGCCARRHARLPFHRVEKWTGSSFVHVSLKDVGVAVHLNHSGLHCPLAVPADARLLILHTNGIHEVALSYCACGKEIPRHLQLLRRGLYPATQQNTRTCATFALLRTLHTLSLTAKTSTYDFYRGLERMTPGYEVKRPNNRYRALMRILTQWRHLKLLKRGGRGHDSSGSAGTADGELALRCPSCPHPGVNLPDNWLEASPELRFLYSIFLCLDANFRLKNNLTSNYSTDPGLGLGMAYMLPRGPYEDYVLSQADQEDISTCVGFQALAKATTRNTRGLRYTGVAAVVCGRSEMLLPNAVGNLQKGERYANIDFVFASAIRASFVFIVAISYDIVCQWFVNLFRRMRSWPQDLRMSPGVQLRPFIPKFHAPAHKEEGHEQYSLNLAEGAGMTDGEAIERLWAPHNNLAASTKTAGPGTRQDVLDDNFADWNFQKYLGMGSTLMRKYKTAVSDRNKQVEAHRGFTASLPPNVVDDWEALCVAWDASSFPKQGVNPYEVEGAAATDAEVVAQLTQLEAAARDAGAPVLHESSRVSFVCIGLELEDSQRRIKELAEELADVPLNIRPTTLDDQRSLLRRRIEGFHQLRSVYMPGLLQYTIDKGSNVAAIWDSDPNPEDVPLWLPSEISADRRRVVCGEGVADIELKLRQAQCKSGLDGVRQVLRLKTRMVYYKIKNIRGQRDGTKSRTVIDRVHNQVRGFVDKYRDARRARMSLEGPGSWERTFQELKNDDVQSFASGRKKKEPMRRGIWEDGYEAPAPKERSVVLSDEEDASDIEMGDVARLTDAQLLKKRKKGTGETRKGLSWIWQTPGITVEDSSGADDLILRAEWAKSRARVRRASEEVQLLREEMRRVLEFLDWSSGKWQQRRKGRPFVDAALLEGLGSYAEKQSVLQQSLSTSFKNIWRTPLSSVRAEADATERHDGDGGFFSSDPLHEQTSEAMAGAGSVADNDGEGEDDGDDVDDGDVGNNGDDGNDSDDSDGNVGSVHNDSDSDDNNHDGDGDENDHDGDGDDNEANRRGKDSGRHPAHLPRNSIAVQSRSGSDESSGDSDSSSVGGDSSGNGDASNASGSSSSSKDPGPTIGAVVSRDSTPGSRRSSGRRSSRN